MTAFSHPRKTLDGKDDLLIAMLAVTVRTPLDLRMALNLHSNPCRALMRTAPSPPPRPPPQKGRKPKQANEKHKQQTTEGGLLETHHPSSGILKSLAMMKLLAAPPQEEAELLIANLASWDLHGGLAFSPV